MNLAVDSQIKLEPGSFDFISSRFVGEWTGANAADYSQSTLVRVHARLCRQNKSIRAKRRLRFAIRLHSHLSMFACLDSLVPYTWLFSSVSSKMKRAKFYPECSGFLRTINLTLKRRAVQPPKWTLLWNDPHIDPRVIAVILIIDPEMIPSEFYKWGQKWDCGLLNDKGK